MYSDCHIHMVLDGVDWRAAIGRHRERPEEPWIRRVLRDYQTAGFTYLRDGGDRWGVCLLAKEIAPEYGLRYRAPGAPLCARGHYGSFIGASWDGLDQYRLLVAEQKARGADFIKIMISGLMDFDRFGVLTEEGLPGETIGALIDIPHQMGLGVMAHANGAETVIAAAKAGVDSVEHGAYLNREALSAMAEAGTVWVPTLSAIGNLRGRGRFREGKVEKILSSALKNVRHFSAMGGYLAPGTDAGAWAVPHGGLTEYILLRQALGGDTLAILDRGIRKIQEKF